MRKVVAYELMSLDGVAESPNDFVTEWDDAMQENLARVIATQDAVILGRRSYEEWAQFWPTSDIQPFSSFINAVSKYVVTSTSLQPQWNNASVVDGDHTSFIRELKLQDGGDIGVHASISLVADLLNEGLVDELRLVVAPHVSGPGRRLFSDVSPRPINFIAAETSPSGYWLATFRVGP